MESGGSRLDNIVVSANTGLVENNTVQYFGGSGLGSAHSANRKRLLFFHLELDLLGGRGDYSTLRV